MNAFRRWLQHPEKSPFRNILFQIHLCIGAALSMYVLLMSMTGSVIVFRNQLPPKFPVEWMVNLHENLLAGSIGRVGNGIGAVCLTLLCLTGAVIWWPGIRSWRRSLKVDWRTHFARISWDLHSALGFWMFLFLLLWGISGVYFAFPAVFNGLFVLDPADRFTDQALYWLARLHFGRFGWFAETVWAAAGMVPGILAFTGMFICCRRVIYKKHSNPNTHPD
jgi:uncharacterized iron-regulated membrane protein